MELAFDPIFLGDLLNAEAEAHGLAAKLRSLAALRESDGLDGTDAVSDAAESMGLLDSVRAQLSAVLDSLTELEVSSVTLGDVHGGMPTLRREESRGEIAVAAGPVSEVTATLERLVARALEEPDRTAVVLPLGLGGTGGCACGDELPEDAPPGPLFDRR